MPLRTWTWQTPPLSSEPKRFEAHLVGFRGMGNTMSSKFSGDGGPIEPGVVLRLPDGRKRCFVRGSFGEEDKKYVMDLYLKEMKRIKAGLDTTKRVKRPNADIRWPNNAKPGEPGTMQVESEHFVWISGSQAGSDGDPWISEKAPDKAQWYRDGSGGRGHGLNRSWGTPDIPERVLPGRLGQATAGGAAAVVGTLSFRHHTIGGRQVQFFRWVG